MIKSPTSLIGFKNAAGVMLAMSAIFAVVISAVTITQDRALGQNGDVEVTLSVVPEVGIVVEGSTITVTEGSSFTVQVTLSQPVASSASAVVIPLSVPRVTQVTLKEGEANWGADFRVPVDSGGKVITSVTFPADGSTDTQDYVIQTVDTRDPINNISGDYAEPQESFTVSLDTDPDTWPDGYVAVEPSSVTIKINDDDNTAPRGDVVIDINDLVGNPVDEMEDGSKIAGFIPRVGHVLSANTSAIYDADNDRSDPADDDLVDEDDIALQFEYQWIRTNDGSTPTDDVDVKIDGAEKSFYELTRYDVGDNFTVQVWSSDQYDNGNGNANDDAADSDVGENSNGFTLSRPSAPSHGTGRVTYNFAVPLIIEGAVEPAAGGDDRIKPGVLLTRNSSGMFNADGYLIGMDGMEIKVDLADNKNFTLVVWRDVTFTWYRSVDGDESLPINECAADGTQTRVDGDLARNEEVDLHPCKAETYELVTADVGHDITVKATFVTLTGNGPDDIAGTEDDVAEEISDPIVSKNFVRVYSPNLATGMPEISGVAQVGSTLTAAKGTIADLDNIPAHPNIDPVPIVEADITYEWFHGDAEDDDDPIAKGPSYVLAPRDAGKTIKVRASFVDALNGPEMRSSGVTTEVAGSPGKISRIEPAIRGVTVSAGDTVKLSVRVYGLQDKENADISGAGSISWAIKDGAGIDDAVTGDPASGPEITYETPSSPGTYTVVASLDASTCQPADEDDRADDCNAEIEVQVRRPSAPVADPVPPVNPPGEIPGLIPDADGNQYEVFTPVEGGTFDGGEGYSINVPSGAVPNGEYIGIRMSDDGAVSNLGMTHQRYTLGGNMYGVHAVDASGAAISSYVLEPPAEVCVPVPASLRTNFSGLSLAAINGDGSLTILAAQVRLDEAGRTMVCGNLSHLPASVAVGAAGAPDAIPTAMPEPTPEPPDTGGTAPTSSTLLLWTLLLGIAVVTLGSALAISRRRPSIPRSPSP